MIDTQYLQYFAAGIFYEMVDGVRKPCEIKQQYLETIAGTNNVTLVGGVGGKKLRCISLTVVSIAAAATTVLFKNAGTGLAITNYFPIIANNVAIPNGFLYLAPSELGHFESDLEDTIYVDTGAGAGVQIYFRYIEFTPIA